MCVAPFQEKRGAVVERRKEEVRDETGISKGGIKLVAPGD